LAATAHHRIMSTPSAAHSATIDAKSCAAALVDCAETMYLPTVIQYLIAEYARTRILYFVFLHIEGEKK
jgi:hypothetical protein